MQLVGRKKINKFFIEAFLFISCISILSFLLPAAYMVIAQTWAYRSPPQGCKYVPFSPQKYGSNVSCEITINKKDAYSIYLAYGYRDEEERKKAALVSGWTQSPQGFKTPLELKITLRSLSGEDLMEENVTPGPAIISGDAFLSMLSGVELQKGSYILTVESLKNAPSFNDLKVSIYFNFGLKG